VGGAIGVSVLLVWYGTWSSATAEQGLLISVMCIVTAMVLTLTALVMLLGGGRELG
jgi:hypothetical protein